MTTPDDKIVSANRAPAAFTSSHNLAPTSSVSDARSASVLRSLPAPLDRPGVTFYAYGRAALLDAIQLIGFTPGDSVLFPEYICREVTEYVQRFDLEARYYRLQANLSPNVEDLTSAIDRRTKAVIVVHYFGFPQPTILDLQEVCRSRGLSLLEDNAHGFLSCHKGRPLGSFGDAAIFSMRKTLRIRDGAALLLNCPELLRRNLRNQNVPRASRLVEWYWLLQGATMGVASRHPALVWLGRRAKVRTGHILRAFALRSERQRNEGDWDIGRLSRGMSGRSMWELSRSNVASIVGSRRQNYEHLLEWLGDAGDCHILWPRLADGVCPLEFPLLVNDGERAISELQRRWIEANYWPDLPGEVVGDRRRFTVANYFREHLIRLPIDESLRVGGKDGRVVSNPGVVERLVAAYDGGRWGAVAMRFARRR